MNMAETPLNLEADSISGDGDLWRQLIRHTAEIVEDKIAKRTKPPTKKLLDDRRRLAEELERLAAPDFPADADAVKSLGTEVIAKYNGEENTRGTREVYGITPTPKSTDSV